MLPIDDSITEIKFGFFHIASRNKKLVAERLPAFLLICKNMATLLQKMNLKSK